MKNVNNNFLRITIGLITFFILSCIASCLVSVFIPPNPIKLASSMLHVDFPKGVTVLANHDNGPGLPLPGGASDGYTFMVLQIPSEKIGEFSNALEVSSSWKPLPLPPEYKGHEEKFQPSFGIEETIPVTSATGYYLFIDHQEEYNKKKGKQVFDTTKPFYERDSENFMFGLFNIEDGKLYLWSIDT